MALRITLRNRLSKLEAPAGLLKAVQKRLAVRPADWFRKTGQHKGKRGWDGFYQFVNDAGEFQTGLVGRVLLALSEFELDAEMVDQTVRPCVGPCPNPPNFRDKQGRPYELRTEQVSALENFLDRGGMLLKAATNSGKTDIALAAFSRVNCPWRFITHRRKIAYQVRERAEQVLGERIGLIGDGEWDVRRITVLMIPTVADHLVKTKTKKPKREGDEPVKVETRWEEVRALLEEAGGLVWDECHRSSTGEWWDLQRTLIRWSGQWAHGGPFFSLAMTGTVPSDDLQVQRLMALSGEIGFEISNREQIEKGYSARVVVIVLECKKPLGMSRMEREDAVVPCAYANRDRNGLIAGVLAVMSSFGLQSMVMTESLKHHHPALTESMNELGLKVSHVDGEQSKKRQDEAIATFVDGESDVLFATTVLDEGFDTPNVHCTVDAGTWGDPITTLQRLGRGIRKKERFNVLFHVVLGDWMNVALGSLSLARIKTLENENAFRMEFCGDIDSVKHLVSAELAKEGFPNGLHAVVA